MDDDIAHVTSRVRFLGVLDINGDVGWRHGHTEANSFGELILAVPNLTWAKVYHLYREKNHRIILLLNSIITVLIRNSFNISVLESV